MDTASDAAEFPWRPRLYARLRGQAHPLFVFDDAITPAASLWAGMRLWTEAFRQAGLRPGDRLILALPPSLGFLSALLAGLWEGLTLALLPPGQTIEGMTEFFDATASVGNAGAEATWHADPCGLPLLSGRRRQAQTPPTPEARVLLATSGTTAAPRWAALSDKNLLAVIDSHLPFLGLTGGRVLSVLPWFHAFGLVIDLLPALFSGEEIIHDSLALRDSARLVTSINTYGITHLSAVPCTVEQLLHTPGGREAVGALRGGVIGGAPVGRALAEALSRTHLRVGYGQTEASPGITLGEPGHWEPALLGQPLGCRIAIDCDGNLKFTGPNACLGFWSAGGLEVLPPRRWVDTGDIVRRDGQDIYFVARADDSFKLSNGRLVQAGVWESRLREHTPQLGHVLLYTADGVQLEILTSSAQNTPSLSLSRAQSILGPLGSRLNRVRTWPQERWLRTRKGDMDRNAMLKWLAAGIPGEMPGEMSGETRDDG